MSDWAKARDAIRQTIDDGWPLGRIEERLLGGLADEQAAALWLYAWSYRERGLRRRDGRRADHLQLRGQALNGGLRMRSLS